MSNSVPLNGKSYNLGDTITFTKQARSICHAPNGLSVEIKFITVNSNGKYSVGLYSPHQKVEEWSDLDGEVGSRRGWWIDAISLEKCIENLGGEFVIDKPLEHRGINLKGKLCRMLAHPDNGTIFVEFNEDISGCSADGLGKAGHCVAVKSNILTKKKRKKSTK